MAGTGIPALGQDTVDIKWKFEKGKTFYQEMTTETKQEMKVMGMQITQNQKQTFYFSWTPVEEKDKNWIIKQKITGLKMDIQIGGTPIQYDSTKDTSAVNNPLSDFFKALVGSEFTLTVSPDFKVTKIEGRDEFLKKLINTNQTMESLLKQILSEDALKQMADPAFAVVPGKPVKKGESWEKPSKLDMGPIGRYETTYKFTYEGPDEKEKNLARIKVEATLKYFAPAGAPAGSNLPFKIVSADLKSDKATGTILFDTEKGRLASSEMSLDLKGKLSIDISGMTSEVDLTQTQKTTVKTTDKDPLEKPAEKPAEKTEKK
jgi:hypothetical protein